MSTRSRYGRRLDRRTVVAVADEPLPATVRTVANAATALSDAAPRAVPNLRIVAPPRPLLHECDPRADACEEPERLLGQC